jgi:hypothetical protein
MNAVCPAFPIFFPARQGKSFRCAQAFAAGMIRHVEINRPVQMWVDEAVHFGASMASVDMGGIKHWPWLYWQRTNEVTTTAKSVRLALCVIVDDWVPKLDSDYMKEVD